MFIALLLQSALPFLIPLLVIVSIVALARSRVPFLYKVPYWVWTLLILALLVAWIAVVLFKWIAQKKKAAALEKGILNQAQWNVDQASPGKRSELEEIRKNLAEAMAKLSQSPQGKKALYSLPWYLVVGPPAIGKTTAIVNSGLTFPGMSTRERMRGAGGTRNIDWWFSTDAILLDSAGRYADEADSSETETEWSGLLDLLKKNRSQGPINGLVLAYSMEAVIEKPEQDLIGEAHNLRLFIDKILDRLGWTFPVYVLFTKCDLVAGFADYFQSLSPTERQQVWGASVEPLPGPDQRVPERFTSQFDQLVRRLRDMRARRVAGLSQVDDWGRVFMFPEEFAGLRSKLALFLETVFEPNPFRKESPLFRGAFFSSGKQMGQPFDLVLRKVRSMLGLGMGAEPEQQVEKEDAYFVRDLFAKVLKVDRDLARRSKREIGRSSRVQVLATAGLAVLALLACLWIGVSFARLQGRIGRVGKVASQVAAGSGSSQGGPTAASLAGLEQLRKEISTDWKTFPLKAANSAREAAETVYLQKAKDNILIPIEEEISGNLGRANQLDAHETRQALQGEVLLTTPKQSKDLDLQPEDLASALATFGFPEVKTGSTEWGQLTGLSAAFLERGEPLIAQDDRRRALLTGAGRLSQTHDPEAFLDGIVSAASQCEKDRDLASFVGEQSVLKTEEVVRAAYTKAGWDKCVSNQLDEIEKTIESDNRLIRAAGAQPSAGAPTKADVLRLYQQAYPHEWAAFLESIRLPSYSDCAGAQDDLKALKSSTASPLLKLLHEAAAEADLGETKVKGVTVHQEGALEPIKQAMSPLSVFEEAPKNGTAPKEEYTDHLRNLYDQVARCAEGKSDFQFDTGIIRSAEEWPGEFTGAFPSSEVAQAMEELLARPASLTRNLQMGRKGQASAAAVASTVLNPFEPLKGKYPFGGSDAADADDVVAFFESIASVKADPDNPNPDVDALQRKIADIRRGLKIDGGLRASFQIQGVDLRDLGTPEGKANLQKIDRVTLTIDGVTLTDIGTHKPQRFSWSTEDENKRCAVVLEHTQGGKPVASLVEDGSDWSWFTLWDAATQARDGEGRYKLTWSFPEQGVEAVFLLTMDNGVEAPFSDKSAFRTIERSIGRLRGN